MAFGWMAPHQVATERQVAESAAGRQSSKLLSGGATGRLSMWKAGSLFRGMSAAFGDSGSHSSAEVGRLFATERPTTKFSLTQVAGR